MYKLDQVTGKLAIPQMPPTQKRICYCVTVVSADISISHNSLYRVKVTSLPVLYVCCHTTLQEVISTVTKFSPLLMDAQEHVDNM